MSEITYEHLVGRYRFAERINLNNSYLYPLTGNGEYAHNIKFKSNGIAYTKFVVGYSDAQKYIKYDDTIVYVSQVDSTGVSNYSWVNDSYRRVTFVDFAQLIHPTIREILLYYLTDLTVWLPLVIYSSDGSTVVSSNGTATFDNIIRPIKLTGSGFNYSVNYLDSGETYALTNPTEIRGLVDEEGHTYNLGDTIYFDGRLKYYIIDKQEEGDDDMSTNHPIIDDDRYFSIDPYTKAITYQDEEPLILARGDHNSERFTFEIPRYVEGHDMKLCNKVEVHFVNSASGVSARSSGVYEVTDLQVSADDPNTVMFSWLISQNATQYAGSLIFAVRFACMVDSRVNYSWRSAAFSGITVVDSVDNAEAVVTQYNDVLEQWYSELMLTGTMGVNMVANARDEAIKAIMEVDVVVEIEQAALNRIKAAGDEVVASIERSMITAETVKEEIITEVLNRIPVYDGATDDITNYIVVYEGETEEVS